MAEIRHTVYEDLDRIAEIFDSARKRMKEAGNPDQWRDDRPSMDKIEKDIEDNNSYVVVENDKVVATFAFVPGIEETYLEIDGAWLDDEPYGTIHRIASDGSIKGIFDLVMDFTEGFGIDIRIDTHKDNMAMRHLIEKHGFVYCGIIIVDDLTPRLAFQKKKKIRQKVLAIVGPTAVGKTAFGIRCASQFNGEIISGDSIQIYRGLDIGSAKPDSEELSQAVHHLIDIKDPDDHYSVKEFQELCREKINEISEKGKLPIIVGGTGLYIKAALYDYKFFEEETKDEQYEDLSNEELYQLLETKDPKALEKIHVNNRKRLIRALNIYEKHNKGISEIKDEQEHKPIYDCLIIGLTAERQILFERINERVDRMIENGLIEEIEGLLNKGISFSDQSMQGIGYKEFKAYFDKDKSLEECIEDVKINSRHFAKRQYTFFNNQLDVKWYDDKDKAIQEVRKWLI